MVEFLTFENAKPFLKEGIAKKDWKQEKKTPKKIMEEYMEFAIEKAENERGLSSERSIDHFTSWLWLDGEKKIMKTRDNDYFPYGIPILKKICKYLGIEYKY